MREWYVAYCKGLKEQQASAAIKEQLGLPVYLPELRRQLAGHLQRRAFFPGYLFVQADLSEVALSQINAIPNVLRLVTFGELPQPVPAGVIEALRLRLDDLNALGGLLPRFQPGEVVRLKRGPLRDLEAVFLGPLRPSERVHVLVEFLGSLRDLELPVEQIERLSAQPEPKRERRTRGQGRAIKAPEQKTGPRTENQEPA